MVTKGNLASVINVIIVYFIIQFSSANTRYKRLRLHPYLSGCERFSPVYISIILQLRDKYSARVLCEIENHMQTQARLHIRASRSHAHALKHVFEKRDLIKSFKRGWLLRFFYAVLLFNKVA